MELSRRERQLIWLALTMTIGIGYDRANYWLQIGHPDPNASEKGNKILADCKEMEALVKKIVEENSNG